jgi:hypothetical protein
MIDTWPQASMAWSVHSLSNVGRHDRYMGPWDLGMASGEAAEAIASMGHFDNDLFRIVFCSLLLGT